MVSTLLQSVHSASRRHASAGGEATIREWAQFFTPPQVAELMARLIEPVAGRVRVLDPGAGTGILGVAAAERLLEAGAEAVHLVAIETEPSVREHLARILSTMAATRTRFSFEIQATDFLDFGGFFSLACEPFDVVISNPPYFKTLPSDTRGGSAPNAYARFMAISVALLRSGGQFSFIVPRSYASGSYFRRFRQQFHSSVLLSHVHLFRSRSTVFREQDVLQETLILAGCRASPQGEQEVCITSSEGPGDIDQASTLFVRHDRIVRPETRECWIHLPESHRDLDVLDEMDGLGATLESLGLRISTGPVVPFRATEWLREVPGAYPLLWMQHVHPMAVRWPAGGTRKPEWLTSAVPASLLVPNEPMVLMRRFSAKEDARRLVAAALEPDQLPGKRIGLENHLNFISYPFGPDLVVLRGLAAFLNSEPVDRYFRIVNGTTQVNATEVRSMRFPDVATLRSLGATQVNPQLDG